MTINILSKLSPKRLFLSRKTRSFSSSSSSSSSASVLRPSKSSSAAGAHTPTSVLPSQASGEWPNGSVGFEYELLQALRLIDRDGDGKISPRELSELLARVGPDPPPSDGELMAMLQEAEGRISPEELESTRGSVFGPACGSELREVFNFFDKDRDGRITAEELLMVFQAIGDEGCTLAGCQRMIDGVNKTGDGFVCFEDFARMME